VAAVTEEAVLLERAKAYDSAALGLLYDRYSGRIYNYIYHRIGESHLAEDLTGQVFLRMLEAIQNERAWQTSFSGWLYRIAHNLIIDHYRRRSHSSQMSLDDAPMLPMDDADPLDAVEAHLTQERLREAIRKLTPEQAQVIVLRFLEGLNIAEVARAMEKTEGAIKALQYRAVMSLREILEEE
jgi:RNA polymerase sigma-70 factor (ECF subfamily)